jgi:hypothetical protein
MDDPVLTTLKQIIDSSTQLSAWALAVLGGTVAAIVSTSHRRPDSLCLRMSYLLFLPGWIAVGYSLYLGNVLSGKYLASLMVKRDQIATIASQVNDAYAGQRLYLLWSLAFFGLWLTVFLLYWVFGEPFGETEKK